MLRKVYNLVNNTILYILLEVRDHGTKDKTIEPEFDQDTINIRV
jgi:hypothetical protein